MRDQPTATATHHKHRWKPYVLFFCGAVLAYVAGAYVVAPALWKRYARTHPMLDNVPNICYAGDNAPGDPLNISLIGNQRELIKIMLAAEWHPADPLSLRSSLKIAEATLLHRPYDDAPVSNLYLFGRKEDLAFEQPVGKDPVHRHHVRFWKSDKFSDDGRLVWLGSATYDRGVGLSHETGQITHHIAADVDAERDHLFDDLSKTGDIVDQYVIDDFHKIREGRNGGGDPWHTDGRLRVGEIRQAASK